MTAEHEDAPARDAEHWHRYNLAQHARAEPRALLITALEHAGPGAGRVAVELGAGAGGDSRALLAAGWRVHAYDADVTGLDWLRGHVSDAEAGRLDTTVVDLATIDRLPAADLIYSAFTLSWLTPTAFRRVWAGVRAALRPGGVLAVNIFGDRDDWAVEAGTTCLTEAEVRELFLGLQIVHFAVRDEHGDAFCGPKHWHVFDVIARA